MAKNKKIVIFDFDGVIADTFDTVYGIHHELDAHLTQAEYRSWFEGNFFEGMNEHYDGDSEHMRKGYSEKFQERKQDITIFDGMCDVLSKLSTHYLLAIVSSNHEVEINHMLDRYGIKNLFEAVYGMETHKSKVYKLTLLQRSHNGVECFYVTDTLGDVKEAQQVGMKTIGVTWGFHDRATLESGTPYQIVDSPQDLQDILLAHK